MWRSFLTAQQCPKGHWGVLPLQFFVFTVFWLYLLTTQKLSEYDVLTPFCVAANDGTP